MRILIISNIKEGGYGESSRPLNFSNRFVELGHDVLHICQVSGVVNGVRFIEFNPQKAMSSFFYRTRKFVELSLRARIFRPHIIYVHQLNNWSWTRLSKALPATFSVYDAHTSVLLEHTSFNPKNLEGNEITKTREALALQESDACITVSKETKSFLVNEFAVPPSKVTVVKNATGITPLPTVSEIRSKRLTCAAVLPQDGFKSNTLALEFLLDVAALMELSEPTVVFKVIGGGKMLEPKSKNVVFTGYVQEFEKEIMEADICLVTYPSEAVCGGVRNKVCDFMALGKPIISTSEGMRGFDDCKETVEFVRAESPDEFVKEILHLKKDSQKRLQLGQSALNRSHNYQWPKRAEEVLATFERLLKNEEQCPIV